MKNTSRHFALTISLIILFVISSVRPTWALSVDLNDGPSTTNQSTVPISPASVSSPADGFDQASGLDQGALFDLETSTNDDLEVVNVSDLSPDQLLLIENNSATAEPSEPSETNEPSEPSEPATNTNSELLTDIPITVSESLATSDPTLTVMVGVTNDDLGQNSPEDFIFMINGGQAQPAIFRGSLTSVKINLAPNINYALSVPTVTYQATFSEGCQGNLGPGINAMCHVNLNDIPINSPDPETNLIPNFDLEISDRPARPEFFETGGYGSNDRIYTYPILGRDNDQAVSVSISAYTDGDAKWYFEPVPVIAGHSYQFSDIYSADVVTELIVEYFDQNKNHLSFDGFISIPKTNGSSDWQTARATFIPPVSAHYLTVFHNLKSVGTLSTDKYRLTKLPQPESFDQGFVSVVFDDGLDSQFKNAFPKLSLADIKGTFYLITHAIAGLSVKNAQLDQPADADGNFNWKAYISPAEYSYPVAGRTGGAAYAKSTELNSNAAWFFEPIEVINDSVYSFSEWYKSSTNTELVAVINKLDGTSINADVTDQEGNTLGPSVLLPSTENTWQQVNTHFYIPADTKDVTVVNRLKGIGEVTIDDISFGSVTNIDTDQIKMLIDAGQEIGLHTKSHKDLTAISEAAASEEIKGSMADVILNGFDQIYSFSYPYGLNNESIQRITKEAGFTSGRSVTPGFNGRDTNPYNLLTESVGAETSLAQVKSWINQAHNDRTWLILVFHDVEDNLQRYPFGVTPERLQSIIDYLKTNNIETQTVAEGIGRMTGVPNDPEQILTKILINPDSPRGVVGDTVSFSATAYDQNFNLMKVQPDFTWSVSNPAVGKIDSVTGFAEAVGVGSTLVYAKSAGVIGQIEAFVDGPALPVVTTIRISPSEPTGQIGDSATFVASVYDQFGSEIIPTPAVDWTSSQSSVVQINSQTGVAIAVGQGTSLITATIGNVTGQTTAKVEKKLVTLSQIGITHKAEKNNYLVGEALDLSGLEVSGLYSDGRIEKIPINLENVTGFNSASPEVGQILTIQVAGKTTTYKVTIKSAEETQKKMGSSLAYMNNFLMDLTNSLSSPMINSERFKFKVNLKLGMQGPDVLELQRRLKEVNTYDGPLTGYFGVLTKEAAQKFQAAYGLPQDGLVGPMTRSILNAS